MPEYLFIGCELEDNDRDQLCLSQASPWLNSALTKDSASLCDFPPVSLLLFRSFLSACLRSKLHFPSSLQSTRCAPLQLAATYRRRRESEDKSFELFTFWLMCPLVLGRALCEWKYRTCTTLLSFICTADNLQLAAERNEPCHRYRRYFPQDVEPELQKKSYYIGFLETWLCAMCSHRSNIE